MTVSHYKAFVARERRLLLAKDHNRVDSSFQMNALHYSMCRRVVLTNCGFKRLNNAQRRAVAMAIMWLEWKTNGNHNPISWDDIPMHARPCVGDVAREQPVLPV